MKRELVLIILFFVVNVAFGQTIESKQNDSLKQKNVNLFREIYWNNLPKAKGWINDYERVFSEAEERKLDSVVSRFERETSVEIVIVTIDTIKIAKETFDNLSLHIAKKWAIGKKGKDNGILIALSKGYKRIRIQNGNGITKIISDEQTKEIIEQDFIPEFKKGNYYKGVLDGINKLIEVLKLKIQ
ncbi:TPM domain-containing protein [Flavobacterium pectinovorum]|uniref:TPM domain-containing protein n=1 Tax=Flavobacterium pectinovorum TaxID=29533 RepID=UPI001FAD97AA|nr:TPM domain-containing protein [Flavobacterium pectinovorum]MCI9846496.1 TPM domain-containing protein [Flavobacterium pectinovorum]